LASDLRYGRILIDVAKEVAGRLHVTVKFVTPRWDWVVAGNWRTHWDLSIGSMAITEERSRVLNFSIPYYYTPAQFALHERNKTIGAVGDFTGKTIGVVMNTTYESYLDPNKPFGNPVFYEPLAAACDKARAGGKEFIKRISTIFESMHADGTLTDFSMKWYGVDISKQIK
jgi:ABC-type amino acid transport substrate-binding protein